MKIVSILFVALFSLISCSLFQTSYSDNESPSQQNKDQFYGDTIKVKVLHYNFMTVGFSETYKQALWVSYQLCDSMLVKNVKRLSGFKTDPQVKGFLATDADYKGSGYDKGHLKPAANCTWDSIAMFESFYYTNVSPQVPSFNRGIWSRLEDMERKITDKYSCIEVVNVPLFDTIKEYIGPGKVPVPHAFGKAFLVEEKGIYKCIAFFLHNEGKPADFSVLSSAAISVDSLEKRSGINLFWYLADSTQTRMEAIISREIFE
jgi:endonuclease G, mitochondrial